MKRIKVVGLCLVAVFAMSAIVASGAQATGAEFGQCVAKKKGEYTTATCAVKSVKAHKGKFEFVPGPSPTCAAQKHGEYTTNTCSVKSSKPKKGKFEKKAGSSFTLVGGPGVLETPAFGGPVECTNSTGSGKITGAKKNESITTFENCQTGGKKCNSALAPSGIITTQPLTGTLIGHGEKGPKGNEPASKAAWTDIVGTSGPSSIFTCEGGIEIETNGDVVGVTTPTNSASNSSTLTFAKAGPEQNLLTTLSLGGSPVGTAPSFQNQVVTLKFAESDEETKAL